MEAWAPAAIACSASASGTLRTFVGAPPRTSKTTTSNPSPYAAEAGEFVGALPRSQDAVSVSIVRTTMNRLAAPSITDQRAAGWEPTNPHPTRTIVPGRPVGACGHRAAE